MLIIALLILSLILRLINLNQSLWLDEAVQAITAQNSISSIFQEITGDFHPPLYHFLMHYWVRLFGISEIALRMPSVLFGVGTVYLIYKISNLSSLHRPKYLSAILLATAPFHIYYSQEARMYSLVTFFTTASFYFFLKIIRESSFSIKKWIFVFYFIFSALAVYTDYYAWLAILAQGIFLIFKRKFKFLILNSIFLIVCYFPWVPMFIIQIKTGMAVSSTLPGWAKLVNISALKAIPLTFIKFTIGRITIFDKKIYALISLGILVVLGVLGVAGIRKGLKKEKETFLIIVLWFFIPLIVSWLASIIIPNYQPFRLLLILPAFYLILARGIEGLEEKRWIRHGVIVTLLVINAVSLSVYYLNPYFQREDWKGLVKFFDQMQNPKLILPSSASNWPIKYYDKKGNIDLISGINGASMVTEQLKIGGMKKDEIYYIRYLVPVFDPQEKIMNSLSKEGYTKVSEISFNQIFVVKYQKI